MHKSHLHRRRLERNPNQHSAKVPAVVGYQATQEFGRSSATNCVGVELLAGNDVGGVQRTSEDNGF